MNRISDPAEGLDLATQVRIHAKMFAYLQYKKANPGCDGEQAHAYAADRWRDHKETACDYLAIQIALAHKEAVELN